MLALHHIASNVDMAHTCEIHIYIYAIKNNAMLTTIKLFASTSINNDFVIWPRHCTLCLCMAQIVLKAINNALRLHNV